MFDDIEYDYLAPASAADRANGQLTLGETPPEVTGRYFGKEATATERESGVAVEQDREPAKPIKPHSLAHHILLLYANGERLTSYEASHRHSGDWHAKRRESTRLLVRGFLVKDGTKPNLAPSGRPHVDAYKITDAGLAELTRLVP